MRTIRQHQAIVAVAFVLGAASTLFVQRVRAAGSPTTSPLRYSGYLVQADGVGVTGTRNIGLAIFDAESGGNRICDVMSTATPVAAGRFQLTLPTTCIDGVKANPDLWVDVQVDGASVGRAKLGAVPYALEATRALEAAHAIRADLATNATNAASAMTASSATSAASASGSLATTLTTVDQRLSKLEEFKLEAQTLSRAQVANHIDTATHWDSCVANNSATSCGVVANRACSSLLGFRGGFWVGECTDAACGSRWVWCFK